MAKSGGSKTLKDINRWQIWLIIAANAVVFYGASQWDTIAVSGFRLMLARHRIVFGRIPSNATRRNERHQDTGLSMV
jgi:hypothetical protein